MTLEQAIDEVNADIAQFKHSLAYEMGALQEETYELYETNIPIDESAVIAFKCPPQIEDIQRHTQKILEYQAQLRYLLRQRDILTKIQDRDILTRIQY